VERAGSSSCADAHDPEENREGGDIERTDCERPLGIKPGERRDCELTKSVDVAENVEE